MATDWKWRVYLFVRAADNTAANRNAFAQIYVDGGSGETVENERKMFDSVVRLSTTGEEPAQAFGVNTAAKTSMRDGFKSLLDGLTNARYGVVANTTLSNFAESELALTNFPVTPNGQIVPWQTALNYLYQEFGLQVISEEPLPEGVGAAYFRAYPSTEVKVGRWSVPIYTTRLGGWISDKLKLVERYVRREWL